MPAQRVRTNFWNDCGVRGAKRSIAPALRAEPVHTRIAVAVRDEQIAVRADGGVGHHVERAGGAAHRALIDLEAGVTLSSAATKCISDVPGLAKQVSTPLASSERTRLSAPFTTTKLRLLMRCQHGSIEISWFKKIAFAVGRDHADAIGLKSSIMSQIRISMRVSCSPVAARCGSCTWVFAGGGACSATRFSSLSFRVDLGNRNNVSYDVDSRTPLESIDCNRLTRDEVRLDSSPGTPPPRRCPAGVPRRPRQIPFVTPQMRFAASDLPGNLSLDGTRADRIHGDGRTRAPWQASASCRVSPPSTPRRRAC